MYKSARCGLQRGGPRRRSRWCENPFSHLFPQEPFPLESRIECQKLFLSSNKPPSLTFCEMKTRQGYWSGSG